MPRLFAILAIILLFCNCKKSIPDLTNINPGNNDDTTTAITAVGTPIGDAVTQTIGAGGGTIVSSDGRIELNIPPGALTADLPITIQPVTNECPNAVGIGYDLLPNGTKFLTPATLTMHYTDDDVNGTDPYFINLAFQDSLNEWVVNIFKDVDTVARTIKFDIPHFTKQSPQAEIKITSAGNKTSFHANEQTILQVAKCFKSQTIPSGSGSPDDLVTLPVSNPLSDDKVKSWVLIGGSQNGTLSASGNSANYTAPGVIDKKRTVTVRASHLVAITSYDRRRRKSITPSNVPFPLSITLTLLPNDLSFSVKLDLNMTKASFPYPAQYHDGATFEVDVKDLVVTVPQDKIVNQKPTVTPPFKDIGTEKVTWIPDDYGFIDIGTVVGKATQDIVSLVIIHTNAVSPSWLHEYPDKTTRTEKGEAFPGYPGALEFANVDKEQTFDPLKGTPGAEGILQATVTPIH